MSDAVKEETRAPGDRRDRTEMIHVAVKTLTESKDFTVTGGGTVRQLKWGLAERLGVPAEQLVLMDSGRVLRESELLSHLKAQDESVSLRMIQRPQHPSAAPTCDPAPEMVQSELTAVLDPDPESFTPSPTSPLCLVECLDSLGLTNSVPSFFPALQHQMDRQLLADPEMMRHVVGSPFVQSTLSSSSPQLTRQLILSSPQIQQLLQTNPEVGDMLNNTDIITEVLELVRNPCMIEDVMHSEDRALNNLQPEQENPETITGDCAGLQKTAAKRLKSSQIQMGAAPVVTASPGTQQPTEGESDATPPVSSPSTDPLRELTATPRADPNPQSTGMQSLVEGITASPGLMESLLSGPYVSSVLSCLSQNPDLAAQVTHTQFMGACEHINMHDRKCMTDAAESPFVLRESTAAAADAAADPSLPATATESRAAVNHVEPQSHGGSATNPTGPTDSGCRGSCTDTYPIRKWSSGCHGDRAAAAAVCATDATGAS
ncbi:ubiquilin-1-like isoform X4 [Anarhichas minor]|uniref:ubiquilin-1-like isoform X4 n=1 Tax=Anarhichas minor TaxID=65739 RepID=UPI003F741A9F